MLGFNRNQERIHILKDVTGILKPSRMTLLLGPPGCGKTILLLALAGKLNKSLKVTGEIDYNGVKLQDFVPEKTSAYIGQYDLHVPEMTVRETLDFSARFQGVGSRAEIMKEVIRREKEAGIIPDPNIDTYMKAISVDGLERSMQTDYIMKIMGLDICADVLVGDAMRRGISGGEKKRLTTGEMIVGPSKALFMDEISTGLDSSTTFQIVSCLQQLAHISESTILVSLLQPAPETYQLFDDIILMAEGQIVYHGPRSCIMSFFESCGFKCPGRKGDADFLQEVLSKKDQQQYWSRTEEGYNFVTVDQFCDKFKASQSGQNLAGELSKPYDESKGHKNALSFSIYSLSKWDLVKACFAREFLLMKRNAFIYITKAIQEMREHGYMKRKLQLLHNITGAFQPGVLSALMGVTGAGKTTLLDVLAGRKTGGVIEGDIRIGGYPKIQQTFARISGYCEQTDVHSPQITVGESVAYSAWLRLPPEIDSKTRNEFVNEVLETIELDEIRDSLVGVPGVNGLSTEQRKRLTIAVELVSNPSIIFMDEPTSGLDARAAAIVMRAVKNVADTGRTVVCTIHQPSIDIFEAFDELMLMKRGGELIYAGPVGHHSCEVIQYFQAIPGVPRIKDNYNPSTWMLEVTSTSMEVQLGADFAQLYRESPMCKDKDRVVKRLSVPVPGMTDLHFGTRFPQKFQEQFKACLWKQCLSYWRTPSYNMVRFAFITFSCIFFGALFWQQGNINHINDQQSLFTILGCMYGITLFAGINNCQSVMPFISVERSVVYRERFAGMYSPWAYSFAQVAMEIPYVLMQVVLFMLIAYPMIGYAWTTAKFFWFMYTMFCTLLCFVYMGMVVVSITPNIQVASIFSSMFYTLQNLMSGFIMPAPRPNRSQYS
ncbi:unnamed protein product [Triticum turgidum subsp. durum]|uniref:ABC transporter domain-containing protein n=1 Tax=Triticum turgidum subsp. durum TaxID=4567 RepID=A0A9R0SUS6_TRITD|nr:unnamed protein product [Triticum turgidum subsp. durum]